MIFFAVIIYVPNQENLIFIVNFVNYLSSSPIILVLIQKISVQMSYFTLQQVPSTITIKNKKRISLIVPYKSTQVIIFYQDCTYDHRKVSDNKILHEGKLKFMPTQYVKTGFMNGGSQNAIGDQIYSTGGYICLIGRKDDTVHFGILNIESKIYQPYEALFHDTRIESQPPKYHIVSNTISGYPLLIQLSPNIENGIVIKCFDFKRRQWLNDILYLGSKYLSCDFLSVPQSVFGTQNTSYFCLIANGEKSQSLHVSCVAITESKNKPLSSNQSHDESFISQSEQSSVISVEAKENLMGFLFNKEVKYYRNFTFVGAHIEQNGHLFMVGNSLLFDSGQKRKSLSQAGCMYMNFLNLANNQEPQYKFTEIRNSTLQRQITVRDYLCSMNSTLVFILQNPTQYTLHKLSPFRLLSKQSQYDQQLSTISKPNLLRLQSSLDNKSLVSYELVCEQFFEKIKDSPSVVKMRHLIKVDKKLYYREMLGKLSGAVKESEEIVEVILSLL